jgi:hypothetical protein
MLFSVGLISIGVGAFSAVLCNISYSPNIIRVVHSRRAGWDGHIVSTERRGMSIGF